MNQLLHRSISVLSLVGLNVLASPALAQDDSAAEALFDRGLKHMEAGRYFAGCPAIAESQRLDPRPGTLFTLSQCEVRWGRFATAVTQLGNYLELYERMPPDQKARHSERYNGAKEQRDKLALVVPQLTLSLSPSAATGTVVKCDDVVIARAMLEVALPVNPGEHVVSTQAPGGPLWEERISIAKGERKAFRLQVRTAPSIEAQPSSAAPIVEAAPEPALLPAAKAGTSGRKAAIYATGGVGVAGLVLGGVMGGLSLAKKPTVKAHCGSAIEAPSEFDCDPTGLAAAESMKTLGLASTIGFAAGLAGVGTAVVLLLTEPKTAKPTTGARGPWISADVLSAGPTGATLGAHGSF